MGPIPPPRIVAAINPRSDESLRRALARLGSEPGLAIVVTWLIRRLDEHKSYLLHQCLDPEIRGRGQEVNDILGDIEYSVGVEMPDCGRGGPWPGGGYG